MTAGAVLPHRKLPWLIRGSGLLLAIALFAASYCPAASELAPPLRNSAILSASSGQDKLRVVSVETYYKVLDLVFPRDILQNQKLNYVFVLRFEPTFHPESQIVISESEGKFEVVKYTALNGGVEMQLNQTVQRTQREDVNELARSIRIRKERSTVSLKTLRSLRASFLDNLRLSEQQRDNAPKDQITVIADGTGYRLWYRGETEVQSEFTGSNMTTPARPDESPLISWMKGVYQQVTTTSSIPPRRSIVAKSSRIR